MTPQELKNSILQLAVQGKLVEQRAEEGTAEELYAKIQAEKQQLIADKKIKKEKPLPEITTEEIPFDIPESWKWVRLGEICNIINGFTPLKTNLEFWNKQEIPWFTVEDIRVQGRVIKKTQKYITKQAVSNLERILPANTVLLCCTASIGEFAITEIPLTTNQQFNGIVVKGLFKNFLEPRYLFSIIPVLKKTLLRIAGKTTFGFISVKKLSNVMLPIPPLNEQNRIATKIEELLLQIDSYEKAWSKLEAFNKRFPDDMQKSILQYAVQGKLVEQRAEEGTAEELYAKIQAEKQQLIADKKIKKEKPLPEIKAEEIPFDIPESWKWVRLGEIGFTNIGLTYKPKDVCSENGTIVLRSSNIQNGKLNFNDIVRVSTNIPDNKMCQKDDILICARNGSKKLVGKAAIIDKNGMSFGAFMAVFRSICNHYILYIINSAYFRNTLLNDTGTTTINQITQEMLRTFLVPLPPLEEQKRIVAKIEELLPLCEKLKK